MIRDSFSTFDVVKALGIPRERLKDWMSKGFVRPSVPAKGKGTKAIFTRDDVYSVAIFKHLVEDFGMKRSAAAKHLAEYKATGEDMFWVIVASRLESCLYVDVPVIRAIVNRTLPVLSL
jgi:hypothetical protein